MADPSISQTARHGTVATLPPALRSRIVAEAADLRAASPAFAHWAAGHGPVVHDALTQWRLHELVERLVRAGGVSYEDAFARCAAADRLASAGLWLVVHMTYARHVHVDGTPLAAGDFKDDPQGHTGGSLNMVPAYVGYLLANALSGCTRGWLMGQGHCVAAIDATNVLAGNMGATHAARYDRSAAGLSRLVRDFYDRRVTADGHPRSPLGSHVNAHTAGGLIEGGYLGFAELLYPHMPLPGERLVVFLSDGAFEEQRGGDWAPRWWRGADSGLVAPIMILNGRRIEQRTSIAQEGGEDWFERHLLLNRFDPIGLDGRDPASMAWGIAEMEERAGARIAAGGADGPRLAYGMAQAPKGYGFPGAATNRAHNLPLPGNPAHDAAARALFNQAAASLYVPEAELDAAIGTLSTHAAQDRPRERDNVFAAREVALPVLPPVDWYATGADAVSPMAAIDRAFLALVQANPQLRPRVGNPDELRSNRLDHTLDALKHRVDQPEEGVAESSTGAVITVLNEEAVMCAALGNKGGINLVVTYEAFAVKMLGALRQEIIFARHQREAGHGPCWLTVPLVLTSHTWENGKNEQSHQDPTLAEVLLGEMADSVRVLFPVDANSAAAMLRAAYRTHGRIAAMVVPKQPLPVLLEPERAERLARDGALIVEGDVVGAEVLLAGCGAYQVLEALRAGRRLRERGVACAVVALGEPARLRTPRDEAEAASTWSDAAIVALFPPGRPRVIVAHTRPEPLLGALRRIDTGPATTVAIGYRNRGGTFDEFGMLFANRCTWAHVVAAAARVLQRDPATLLAPDERDAVDGRGDPEVLR